MIKQTLPYIIFSFEQLVFLKRTLAALEQVMQRQTQPLPKLNFAKHTVIELKAKIETLLNAKMWGKVVEMDANELLMLQTSVWIFTAALDAIPDVKEKKQLQKQCQTVSLFLAPFSKQMFHQN